MKKLLVAAVLAIAFTSCKKDDHSVSTEFKFIGSWECHKYESFYEYGMLNPDDTTIRIVEGTNSELYNAQPGELVLNFTTDSLFVSDSGDVGEAYEWNYDDDILCLMSSYLYGEDVEYDNIYFTVETLDNSNLIFSISDYYSYTDDDMYFYWEEVERFYFEKVNSLQEVTVEVERIVKNHKASFIKRMKEKYNRKQ